MKANERRLAELRAAIREVTPREALALQAQGAALIDVREADEIAQGSPPGGHRLGRGFLELKIEDAVPDFERPLVVMCNSGARSLFAAEDLKRLGYRKLFNMAGGFTRWKNEGLPVEVPPRFDPAARERYSRHLTMPEVGEAGQLKLIASKVILVGAGGLGSPAAMYLAAAGVGTLGIIDHDVVDRSNLQRQILHTDARVGTSKVASARQTLEGLNPAVKVVPFEVRLSSKNAEESLQGFDVVVDGSDNFPTRYLINDVCVKLGVPNVHGSVYRFEGQSTVFWPRYPKRRGPCYRCLYPEPPPAELAPPRARLFAKLESVNPGGSIKDRPVARMLTRAIAAGRFAKGRRLLDSSSGNAGISYAMLGAELGVPVTIVVPGNASQERLERIRAHGAELVITDPIEGYDFALREAHRLAAEHLERYWYCDQYSNEDNWRAHYEETSAEILFQLSNVTGETPDAFVAGVGTGGTLTGVGRRLREVRPDVRIVAAIPDTFPGIEGLKPLGHPGDIVPKLLDQSLIDERIQVTLDEAVAMCRRLTRHGLFVGPSSGAFVHAALEVASRQKYRTIVTVLSDTGERYVSTGMWKAEPGVEAGLSNV